MKSGTRSKRDGKKKAKLMVSYHAVGMGKYDGFEVWEITDMGDWEAFSEEALRCWNKYWEHYEFYIGINEPYFVEATKDIPYHLKLRKRARE